MNVFQFLIYAYRRIFFVCMKSKLMYLMPVRIVGGGPCFVDCGCIKFIGAKALKLSKALFYKIIFVALFD